MSVLCRGGPSEALRKLIREMFLDQKGRYLSYSSHRGSCTHACVASPHFSPLTRLEEDLRQLPQGVRHPGELLQEFLCYKNSTNKFAMELDLTPLHITPATHTATTLTEFRMILRSGHRAMPVLFSFTRGKMLTSLRGPLRLNEPVDTSCMFLQF